MKLLAEDAIAELPCPTATSVETPTGSSFSGILPPPISNICVVSIVRAGDSLLEAVRESLPGVSVGKILIQRMEETEDKHPKLFYRKLPPDIAKKIVLLCDPMVRLFKCVANANANANVLLIIYSHNSSILF